jgi:hypothetical protein
MSKLNDGPPILQAMLELRYYTKRQLDPDYDDIPEDLPEDDEDDDHPSLTAAECNPSLA